MARVRTRIGTRAYLSSLCAALVTSVLLAGPAAAAQPPLASYTGGDAVPGGKYQLVVARNGKAVISRAKRKRSFHLSASDLATLRRLLIDARFQTLQPYYATQPQSAVWYGEQPETVAYNHRSVTIAPHAPTPGRLKSLLEDLRALVARNE